MKLKISHDRTLGGHPSIRQHRHQADTDALSILTLDDDPIMTSTIQAYFQRSGYRVDVENDPCRAIKRIRQGSYDILLLDYLMSPSAGIRS